MKLRSALAAALFGFCATTIGCGGEEDSGVGSDTSNVSDSFAKPTDHGELQFGLPNQAKFTDAERFHAWSFTLTDAADLVLRTELIAHNLDTKIYLYRREIGSESKWGSNIASNDDSDGTLASKIEGSFEAGEYLLKVKATKSQLRGEFVVHGDCSGAGCPVQGGVCENDMVFEKPAETNYGLSCGGDLAHVLGTPTTSEVSVFVPFDDQCLGGSVAARAMQAYSDYWNDFSDIENEGLNVQVYTHGESGFTAEVDQGGDEDTLFFVFDNNEQLLALYHSEQSPLQQWYCADEGEPTQGEPDEDCMAATLWGLRHGPSSEVSDAGTTTAEKAAENNAFSHSTNAAIQHFVFDNGLEPTAPVQYEITQWEGDFGDGAAHLTLTNDSTTARYYAGSVFGDPAILLEDFGDGAGYRFMCQRLE